MEKNIVGEGLALEGLVLEGGGVLGISYIGALKELIKNGIQFKAFIGSSIGSVFALLMACRADFDFIEKYVSDLDIKTLIDDPNIFTITYRLLYKFGYHSTINLRKQLQLLIKKITDKDDLTFIDVQNIYSSHLAITSFSLEMGKTTIFNPIDTPNMSVIDACIHSCNVPLFFTCNGYIDGGIKDNYPISYMDNLLGPGKSLGLILTQKNPKYIQPKNFYTFIKYVAEIIFDQAFKLHIRTLDMKNTIKITVSDNISFLNFEISEKEKTELINDGRSAIQSYLKKI